MANHYVQRHERLNAHAVKRASKAGRARKIARDKELKSLARMMRENRSAL